MSTIRDSESSLSTHLRQHKEANEERVEVCREQEFSRLRHGALAPRGLTVRRYQSVGRFSATVCQAKRVFHLPTISVIRNLCVRAVYGVMWERWLILASRRVGRSVQPRASKSEGIDPLTTTIRRRSTAQWRLAQAPRLSIRPGLTPAGCEYRRTQSK